MSLHQMSVKMCCYCSYSLIILILSAETKKSKLKEIQRYKQLPLTWTD